MKLYITRHGKTKWNEEGRLQGKLDSDLTDDGIKKAISLSKRMEKYDINCIFTSISNRAIQTSKYIRNEKNIPIICLEELCEMSFGNWDGMKLCDIKNNYTNDFDKFEKDPINFDNKSGETFIELINRVKIALENIKKSNYENVLIVTHGITVKAIQTILEKRRINDISKLPVITGCTLILYEIQDDIIEKIFCDDMYDFIPDK